jgi:hypothetical protein
VPTSENDALGISTPWPPACDRPYCGRPLDAPGALLLGPPVQGLCSKRHLCQTCYEEIMRLFNEGPLRG